MYIKKTVIECVKDVKYIYWVKKMSNIFIGLNKTCLGILDRRERDNDNETGLKVIGVIEISTTVLPFAMLAPSL